MSKTLLALVSALLVLAAGVLAYEITNAPLSAGTQASLPRTDTWQEPRRMPSAPTLASAMTTKR